MEIKNLTAKITLNTTRESWAKISQKCTQKYIFDV